MSQEFHMEFHILFTSFVLYYGCVHKSLKIRNFYWWIFTQTKGLIHKHNKRFPHLCA